MMYAAVFLVLLLGLAAMILTEQAERNDRRRR